MEFFKLDPTAQAANGLRNCGNCVHRYEERLPNQMMSSLVCHRFPPQLIVAPVPTQPTGQIQLNRQQNPPLSYQVMSMFPVVQPQQFCHCHDPRPAAGNEEGVPVVDPDSNAGRSPKNS